MSDLHQIFTHVTYVRGSDLLCRRCDMLCTSGFMSDVIFAHNEPYAGVMLAVPQPLLLLLRRR